MGAPPQEVLDLVAYRMHSVAVGHLALRYSMAWDEAPPVDIRFDGKQVIEGRATAFTNPAIEAAIIHSRALLEFLGLRAATQTTLAERGGRLKPDDVGVESFAGLAKLSVAKVQHAYPGSPAEAEAAMAYVIHLANKGLAHTTSSFTKHDQGSHLLEIALRGVPVLVINAFYVPLGLQPPDYKVPGRKAGPAPDA